MTATSVTLTARAMMTPLEECVGEDDSVLQAARHLLARRLAATAVVARDGRPIGIIANADIVRAVVEGRELGEMKTGQLMAPQPESEELTELDPSDPFERVIEAMNSRGAQSLPVIAAGELIGIVTRADLRSFSYEAPDGLPLPPPNLIYLVAGSGSRRLMFRDFYEIGLQTAHTIRSVLRTSGGAEIESCEAILDFGCGCGRVMRHWSRLTGPDLFGADYAAEPIEWCKSNWPFADFRVNSLAPPLEYDDSAFDFAYGISVFTHLAEDDQLAWMAELKRVLRPGGLLFLTMGGEGIHKNLPPEQREAFLAGELVVVRPELSGRGECEAYHPRSYVHETIADGFELLDLVSRAQGFVLLRKPALG